ncbi:hypothetical protein ACOSP7_017942 [Xanthoceras sorbifolium]
MNLGLLNNFPQQHPQTLHKVTKMPFAIFRWRKYPWSWNWTEQRSQGHRFFFVFPKKKKKLYLVSHDFHSGGEGRGVCGPTSISILRPV